MRLMTNCFDCCCVKSVVCCQEILVLVSIRCYVGITARKSVAASFSSMEDVEETATGSPERNIIHVLINVLSFYYFLIVK